MVHMGDTDFLLVCNELSKQYGDKKALQKVSFSLLRGRIIGLLGPNGSGKTTFMKICNGLLQPTYGAVTIGGHPIGIETKKIVSFLPERTYFTPWMKVKNLVQMFKDFYTDFNEKKAHELLHSLQIDEKAQLKQLSKGTKEKVQLILVMSREADLYMLDEPIGGVDPAARDYILHAILANYNRNASILISTHLIREVEPILDEAIFLKDGEILKMGTVQALHEELGCTLEDYFKEAYRCF